MNKVEEKYQEHLNLMSGSQKFLKACMLCQEFYDACKNNLIKENPSLSSRELKIQLAKKFYPNNQSLLKLID